MNVAPKENLWAISAWRDCLNLSNHIVTYDHHLPCMFCGETVPRAALFLVRVELPGSLEALKKDPLTFGLVCWPCKIKLERLKDLARDPGEFRPDAWLIYLQLRCAEDWIRTTRGWRLPRDWKKNHPQGSIPGGGK